jgi:2-phosphosulfolactate phosphatase
VQRAHRQGGYRVRFDWGLSGATAVAEDAGVAVVIDVLSFTTTLSVALDAGTVVRPCRWNDERAQRYAGEVDAVLAVSRSRARPGQASLSPASIRATRPPARLVLPSPNGSAIADYLAARDTACVGACLRNAAAVARWVRTRYVSQGATVAVIAAGERWPDGTLRPAVEDLWGAGAVIAGGVTGAEGSLSPEAGIALAGYQAIRGTERDALLGCAGSRELVEHGYRIDVEIAAEIDRSETVPLLTGGRFAHAEIC